MAQLGSQSWTGPNNTHWGDGFDLTPAFVLVYGTTELEEIRTRPCSRIGLTWGTAQHSRGVTGRTWAALEPLLDMYPEMRAGDGE